MNILRPKLLITNYQINFIPQFDNELKNKHNYKYILFYHFMPHHLNVLHLKIKYFIHIFIYSLLYHSIATKLLFKQLNSLCSNHIFIIMYLTTKEVAWKPSRNGSHHPTSCDYIRSLIIMLFFISFTSSFFTFMRTLFQLLKRIVFRGTQ